ncbi:chloride channel-like protein 3 [Macroventuria anomochaeta]|uniref:Chloride channel-like protein 3 n=1 Tax=Macroventuria anomochaeta TaxID=301207 RepID=A0ACB6SDT6_9PLEO|nr:chloride channel-like protein 3 [Macroventuria anomochaeta]KAF2632163.1 chloride channel-like protein 3 [Macroventuria anomochaeta]
MPSDLEAGNERTPLLHNPRLSQRQHEQHLETASAISSTLSKEEQQLVDSTVGERLPYNDYTTIDWLHDLVQDSYRFRHINSLPGLRYKFLSLFDAYSGWIAVVIIGALTAGVAFLVDIAVATVADWKMGYCSTNAWKSRENCCRQSTLVTSTSRIRLLTGSGSAESDCDEWHAWSDNYARSFAIYVALALVFGTISSSATLLTRSQLPSAEDSSERPCSPPIAKPDGSHVPTSVRIPAPSPNSGGGKVMYMAAGSGIPEIKTILSGFSIPSFLSLRVLIVKAFGAVFAVSTGMCLGKEGPFVHISTCLSYLVGMRFPKYKDNGRKMRELLSAGCSSGLSVAFGAPIGGVLFSYEEISTYFPRKVLWRAFLCSLTAAIVLKQLNPTGTGKLVLFETKYGTEYESVHYLVFTLLGVAGGVFGGLFCKLNFIWSRYFRRIPLIKENPVFEVGIVVLATALLQFPNPLTREPGDIIIKTVLVDCKDSASAHSFICIHESHTATTNWAYVGWLLHGTLTKLVLTIITFGCKVPSGVIIPALDAGALFGRLVGYLLPYTPNDVSPGIFALVGAAAFLAGVSRMTISLAVIMFELTGQLEYVVPSMLAILVAKWVADAISAEGVYDLAQTVLGHPFLDPDVALQRVRKKGMRVGVLVPPRKTMEDVTVHVPAENTVSRSLLRQKLDRLQKRGLIDAGLVLVQTHSPSTVPVLQGYISQSELTFGLENLAPSIPSSHSQQDFNVRLLGHAVDEVPPDSVEVDLSPFVDRTPLTICSEAPLEYAVEMFAKLGLRYLCVTEEGTGALVGVVIKKRLVGFVEGLKEGVGG